MEEYKIGDLVYIQWGTTAKQSVSAGHYEIINDDPYVSDYHFHIKNIITGEIYEDVYDQCFLPSRISPIEMVKIRLDKA